MPQAKTATRHIIAPRCACKGCHKSAMPLGKDLVTGADRWTEHCDRHATRDEKLIYFAAWGLKW